MSYSPVITWFEIPVLDFDRARAFYEAVLGQPVTPLAMGPVTMGMLPGDSSDVGGALFHGERCVPFGFFAQIRDTAGNTVGIHSMH